MSNTNAAAKGVIRHGPDPVFLNSRREAILIVIVWFAALLWSVPCSYIMGFTTDFAFDPQRFTTVMGVPAWVFWGVAVPWIMANVFTVWFCFFYMVDDDLEPHANSTADDTAREQSDRREGKA